jgi:hypothetical protein
MELSFQERYGELESHLWLDGGMVLAGFRSGQVAVVAATASRASHGTEVFSSRCGAPASWPSVVMRLGALLPAPRARRDGGSPMGACTMAKRPCML